MENYKPLSYKSKDVCFFFFFANLLELLRLQIKCWLSCPEYELNKYAVIDGDLLI